MSVTPFLQFIFPIIELPGGTLFTLRINKIPASLYATLLATYDDGYLGYDPVTAGKITASQRVKLDDIFTVESIGDYVREMHDLNGSPKVPTMEFSLGDFFFLSGVSNAIPVYYDVDSFLDEIFSDPTALYEAWFDRLSSDGSTVEEVWFGGDIDYVTIPAVHRTGVINPFTSSAQYPGQQYNITANLAIERFTANKARDFTDPTTGAIVTPGSIFDFAFGYRNGKLRVWNGPAPSGHTPKHIPIYPGKANTQPYADTLGATPYAIDVGYIWPQNPTNITSWSIQDLADLLAQYGGFKSNIDSTPMFDYYLQDYEAGTGRYSGLSKISDVPIWGVLSININFLLGTGIPVAGGFDPFHAVVLTGTSGHGGSFDVRISGLFFGFNTQDDSLGTYPFTGATQAIYLGGTIVGTNITLVTCNDTFTGIHALNGDNLTFTGTINGTSVLLSGTFAGGTVTISGTYSGGNFTLNGSYPLLFQWPNTITPDSDVITLATWISVQTGTWIDQSIDTSGNLTLQFRARRPLTPGAGGAAYFQGTYLSINDELSIVGSSVDPSEITATSVIVQCLGGGPQMMAGKDQNNAVNITLPWQCKKQGEYTANDGNVFYNPDGSGILTIEQWWNTAKDLFSQAFCVSADAKVSRPDPNNSSVSGYGAGDYAFVAATAIPTVDGWCGGSMLLYELSDVSAVVYSGEYPPSGWNGAGYSGNRTPPITGDGFIGVAAILPAGLTPPTDEFCGGYFNPQNAAAQFYYQEIVGTNGQKIVLPQDYNGFLGDDGTIQGLRPGLYIQQFIRGKNRLFVSHSVTQSFMANACTVQWKEVPSDGSGNPTWVSVLPSVAQIGTAGGGATGGSGAPAGGSGGLTPGSTFVVATDTISADTDDYAPPACNLLLLNVAANCALKGMKAGTPWQLLMLKNAGPDVLVVYNNASATAANNFSNPHTPNGEGGNLPIMPKGSASYRYNPIDLAWELENFSASH